MTRANSLKLASEKQAAVRKKGRQHVYGKNVICVTEKRASPKHEWRADPKLLDAIRKASGDIRTEIVVDATEGFIPLWAEHTTLRWRFDDLSMQAFENPEAAKLAIKALFEEAVAAWGRACPVSFAEDESLYDFEIVMRSQKRCSPNGCVLASAFFPGTSQDELVIYPSMFEQPADEQVETLVHEIGHIFGLRHFFALIKEAAWPAIIYGKHKKFSIMNYGGDSRLTRADKDDLKRLYENVWRRKIVALNGTPVRLMNSYSSHAL